MTYENVFADVEVECLRERLEQYQAELSEVLQERSNLDQRILGLQKDIRRVAGLCNVEIDDQVQEIGLTDAIRYVIGNAGRPVSPAEVRDELLAWYCKPEDYRNLLGSVHTIIRRLARSGDITYDESRATCLVQCCRPA